MNYQRVNISRALECMTTVREVSKYPSVTIRTAMVIDCYRKVYATSIPASNRSEFGASCELER